MIKKGFTLIELLIVIGLIGALAGIVLVTYPAATQRARDSQRKSDLKQYQIVLEDYANRNNGFYPRRSGSGGNGMSTLCGDLGIVGDCVQDPKNNSNKCDTNTCKYYYRTNQCGAPGDPCAVRYILFAALERPETNGYYWGTCSTGESREFTSASLPSDLNSFSTCP